MKLERNRIWYDLQYVVLNQIVCKIPCWSVRRYFYRRYGVQMGKDSRIGIGTVIICPQNIRIGARTVVNEDCVLDGRGGLAIGHDRIGAGAVVKNTVSEQSVVIGNPAREIKKRKLDRQYCLDYKAYFR